MWIVTRESWFAIVLPPRHASMPPNTDFTKFMPQALKSKQTCSAGSGGTPVMLLRIREVTNFFFMS
jgi:hypothetical protein